MISSALLDITLYFSESLLLRQVVCLGNYLLRITKPSFETIKVFSDEFLTNNIERFPVFITTITNMPKKISKNDILFLFFYQTKRHINILT